MGTWRLEGKYSAAGGAEAGIADEALDLGEREHEDRPRGRDHVLLDHRAPHVVDPVLQGDLPDLGPLGKPRGLDVGDVIQHQAGNGHRPEIYIRPPPCRSGRRPRVAPGATKGRQTSRTR